MGGEEKQVSLSKNFVTGVNRKLLSWNKLQKVLPAFLGAILLLTVVNHNLNQTNDTETVKENSWSLSLRNKLSNSNVVDMRSDAEEVAVNDFELDGFASEEEEFAKREGQQANRAELNSEMFETDEEEEEESEEEDDSVLDNMEDIVKEDEGEVEIENGQEEEQEEDEIDFNLDDAFEHFLPLPARIRPAFPDTFVNYRTSNCGYLCHLAMEVGYKISKQSAVSPFKYPPEMISLGYKRYPQYASLRHTIINHIGKGSSCIGGGKGRQLSCRKFLAQSDGCEFEPLRIQPPQWNIQTPAECKRFFEHAEKTNKIWIAKPGGSYHGRGITIHDDVAKMKKVFGSCRAMMGDGVIIQEYIKYPALMDGHKFDFRSYLLIASTEPFLVFYHDGFIRKAEGVYSTDSESLKDPLKQVTNDERQSSEDHFFSFEQLETLLHKTYKSVNPKFTSDFIRKKFVPHAMRVTNYLFHTAKLGTKKGGISPTPGRFQIFALDWMIDAEANFHLLEGNGNPLVTHYPNTDLTPELWTSLLKLEKYIHTQPEELLTSKYKRLSVEDGFKFERWNLVYNQMEVETKAEEYHACKFNQYATENHPLFSYNNYGV